MKKLSTLLAIGLLSSLSSLASEQEKEPQPVNPFIEAAKKSLEAQNKPATHEAMWAEVGKQMDLELAKMKSNSEQRRAEMAISNAHALARIDAEVQAIMDNLMGEAEQSTAESRKVKK